MLNIFDDTQYDKGFFKSTWLLMLFWLVEGQTWEFSHSHYAKKTMEGIVPWISWNLNFTWKANVNLVKSSYVLEIRLSGNVLLSSLNV